jgi:hypothetical protein
MSTVLIDFRSISWGGPNEDDNNDVWALEDSSSDPGSVVLTSFGSVGDPVSNFPAPATWPLNGQDLKFVFWNATNGTSALSGYPSADPQRKLNVPAQPVGTIVHATAWYAPAGSGPGGKPGLRARTFDIDLNGFRKETPILSATPEGAWPGPNSHSVASEKAAPTVTPKNQLLYPAPVSSQPPGTPPKEFKHWQPVVGDLTVDAMNLASCPQGKSALALAFYGHSDGQRALNLLDIGRYRTADYWAEFWGKLGAEGEGPFGPHGPGTPWGPLVGRLIAALAPEQLKGQLEGQIASLQQVVEGLQKQR